MGLSAQATRNLTKHGRPCPQLSALGNETVTPHSLSACLNRGSSPAQVTALGCHTGQTAFPPPNELGWQPGRPGNQTQGGGPRTHRPRSLALTPPRTCNKGPRTLNKFGTKEPRGISSNSLLLTSARPQTPPARLGNSSGEEHASVLETTWLKYAVSRLWRLSLTAQSTHPLFPHRTRPTT